MSAKGLSRDGRPPMVEAHCYAYNRGGINNQKIALFGLYLMSLHREPHRLVLPDLCCFDQMGE